MSGITGVQARLDDIRARFEPPRPAESGAAPSDFGEVLGLVEQAAGSSASPFAFLSASAGSVGRTQLAAPFAEGRGIVERSTAYLGVPYLWGGTDPQVGLDCSGFVQLVHRELGIELPRVSRDQARAGQPVASLADARPGDVLAFGEPVNHVAIYVGDGQMIHAPRRGDVVKIEPIDRPITAIRRYGAVTHTVSTEPVTAMTAGSLAVGAVPYAHLFNAAGARYGLDPRLLAAVAQVESGFNPNAVSRAGARGLMQFMPATAAGMGIDPLDPAQAVDGAARYLRTQLDAFGSLELALAAYNAGPGAVSRHGGIPPYAETQAYVPKVLAAMNGVR